MAEQMELIVVEQRGEEQFLTVAGQHLKAVEVFTGPDGVEKIIADIEAQVKAFQPDVSTAKGRKEIAAMAYKVSQSKVVLFNPGKSLTADWKAKAKKVDDAKATVTERLDALRDATRAPLTAWEEAEKAREAAEKLAKEIEDAHAAALAENDLFNRARELAAREAELARIEAERVAKEEAERAAQEAKEAAERAEAERLANEERIRREAEEKAKREAEEAAAAAIAEAERKEREAKEAAERAEREKTAAAEKAEADRIAAIKQAEEEKAAAVRAAEEKARREAEAKEADRLRQEREAAAKLEAERKEAERKAADVEHRRTVNRAASEALGTIEGITDFQAREIVVAIATGMVPNVTITY